VAGSQPVATTAVSSAKVAVMESGEVGRSAVYKRYIKGSRTLPWGIPALTGVKVCEFSVDFYDEVAIR
jgi:hypothetical protein